MSTDSKESLELLSLFLRGLSHTVRTPLSVISNEFHFLRSIVGEEEVERGIRRCRELDHILRRLEVPISHEGEPKSPFAKILVDSLARLGDGGAESPLPALLVAEVLSLQFGTILTDYLSQLLSAHGGTMQYQLVTQKEVTRCTLLIQFPGRQFPQRMYSSISRFQFDELKQPLPEPPLIDSIIRGLGGSTLVEAASQEARLILVFPSRESADE